VLVNSLVKVFICDSNLIHELKIIIYDDFN